MSDYDDEPDIDMNAMIDEAEGFDPGVYAYVYIVASTF